MPCCLGHRGVYRSRATGLAVPISNENYSQIVTHNGALHARESTISQLSTPTYHPHPDPNTLAFRVYLPHQAQPAMLPYPMHTVPCHRPGSTSPYISSTEGPHLRWHWHISLWKRSIAKSFTKKCPKIFSPKVFGSRSNVILENFPWF